MVSDYDADMSTAAESVMSTPPPTPLSSATFNNSSADGFEEACAWVLAFIILPLATVLMAKKGVTS